MSSRVAGSSNTSDMRTLSQLQKYNTSLTDGLLSAPNGVCVPPRSIMHVNCWTVTGQREGHQRAVRFAGRRVQSDTRTCGNAAVGGGGGGAGARGGGGGGGGTGMVGLQIPAETHTVRMSSQTSFSLSFSSLLCSPHC